MAQQIKAITVEDLYDKRVEVVDGRMVKMAPVGMMHVMIVKNIARILDAYITDQGFVFTDSLIYVLEHDREAGIRRTRIPDVSFVTRERIQQQDDLSKPFYGAPDLAVEVISPNESADNTQGKLHDYLEAGTQQVWIVYPTQREVYQYVGTAQNVSILTDADQLAAEDILPGLTVDVAAIFALPDFLQGGD